MLLWRGLRWQTRVRSLNEPACGITFKPSPRVRHRSKQAAQDEGRPPTVAIIGSGPAGFYTAQKLMREIHGTVIDMYEQLPVPFGLVRFGVAPDHPEVKNCQDTFQDVAASSDFTFIGNVNLGHDLPLPLLAMHYDALVFAYGASKDRKLGLEGEDKPHIYSARAFVGWYNGLPEYHDLNPDLMAGEHAVIIGQGNVALDVARTLLTDVDALRKTDITERSLEVLSKSQIKHVQVIGRRGPLQAAFTIKEIRELMHLPDVNFNPIAEGLLPADSSKLPRPRKRLLELLKKGSPHKAGATKSWSLDFLLSPVSLEWSQEELDRLIGVKLVRNELLEASSVESRIRATSDNVVIPTSTLFRSIGYKAEPITGMDQIGAVFDDARGTVSHDGYGRVPRLDNVQQPQEEQPASLYCAGWVKRGPTGVIASTMTDAYETAQAVVDDWRSRYNHSARPSRPKRGWHGVKEDAAIQNVELRPVHWENWKSIDSKERVEGEMKGKPREKLATIEEMLLASSG